MGFNRSKWIMSIDSLRAIAGCGRPWAAERAEFAIMITEQYQAGGISQSEYQELMQDLVRSDRLDAEADDLELKTALFTAVYAVAQLS
jgi:hypothetical protein